MVRATFGGPSGRDREPGQALSSTEGRMPSSRDTAGWAGSSAVEHVTFNHVVEGSIPSRLTMTISAKSAPKLDCPISLAPLLRTVPLLRIPPAIAGKSVGRNGPPCSDTTRSTLLAVGSALRLNMAVLCAR